MAAAVRLVVIAVVITEAILYLVLLLLPEAAAVLAAILVLVQTLVAVVVAVVMVAAVLIVRVPLVLLIKGTVVEHLLIPDKTILLLGVVVQGRLALLTQEIYRLALAALVSLPILTAVQQPAQVVVAVVLTQ